MEFLRNLSFPLHIQHCIGYFTGILNPLPLASVNLLAFEGQRHRTCVIAQLTGIYTSKRKSRYGDFWDTHHGCLGAHVVIWSWKHLCLVAAEIIDLIE